MSYLAVKHLHVTCAVISISLFTARGFMQFKGIAWRRWRWLRIAPHINDTILLGAAIWMVSQFPAGTDYNWIIAKLVALLAYIGIGKVALSDKTPAARRPLFLFLALASVAYILGAALTHSPTWGILRES